MARRNRSAVRRYHDRVARRYDSIYDDAYWRFHDAVTWDYIKPHLPPDLSRPVLDAGCGTGKWALRLLDSGYRVTCVDIAGSMVEAARRKIAQAGKIDRAAFVAADLCDLSGLPEEHFGLIVALGEPVGCAGSPAAALKQLRKRLAIGGTLILTLDNRWAALGYYLERGNVAELSDFVDRGRTCWLTRDKSERFEIHTYSPDQAIRLIERAGFEVVEMIGKTVLDVRAFRDQLDDPVTFREWMRIEKKLARRRDAVGRAAHLQITARVISPLPRARVVRT